MRGFGIILGITVAAGQAVAEPILAFPLDCTLGTDCFIQQYVDRDPSEEARDFTCSSLSYDGHKGTDFRVPDFADLEPGVPVLASAAGVVRGIRDGMTDGPLTPERRAQINNQECGNGVVIDHGDGWETQYCHLKQGSVSVSSGDTVETGTVLGRVGQSGLAAFPHLHLSVRNNGVVVDPFAPNELALCGVAEPTLWDTDIPYQPGGLLNIGFSTAIPEFADIRAGTAEATILSTTAPALVIWGYMFGTQAGDKVTFSIIGPTGQEVHSNTATLERTQAEAFRASGRRLRAPEWRGGLYQGHIEMVRDGEIIAAASTEITLTR